VKKISKIYLILIFSFLYLPIAVMIFFSFNDSNSRVVFTGFSIDSYIEMFKNKQLMNALSNSLLIAVLSSVTASVLGTMAAIGIYNLKNKTKRLVMNVSNLPIINPEIVTGVSLMLLFVVVLKPFNMYLGFTTVLLSHILFNTPYIILNVMPSLRRMDISMYEAALDLGCVPSKAFFKVVLPEIFPGIFAGFLITFTFSLDDFVISYFTGGNFQTLSVFINDSLKRGIQPWMLALTSCLFLFVFTILLIMKIKDIKQEKNQIKKHY